MFCDAAKANHKSTDTTLFDLVDGCVFGDEACDTGDTFGITNGCCGSEERTRNCIFDCMCVCVWVGISSSVLDGE